jgi:hypothetical protein
MATLGCAPALLAPGGLGMNSGAFAPLRASVCRREALTKCRRVPSHMAQMRAASTIDRFCQVLREESLRRHSQPWWMSVDDVGRGLCVDREPARQLAAQVRRRAPAEPADASGEGW